MDFIDEQVYKNEIGIYKIQNLCNGKVYIGQTREKFQRRYWLHRWKLRNGTHDNFHLQKAWNKYGENNFIFEVVETIPEDFLDEREKYWIKFYRQFNLCYSIQDGGQPKRLCDYVTPEQRKLVGEKNRQRMIGSKLPEEVKRKMSETRKGKHVQTKNTVLTPEKAKAVKEMLIEGKTPKEIMQILDIPYKPINAILSANTWAFVEVEGWEEFQKNRPRGKGRPAVGRKFNDISLEECKKIL